MNSKKRPKDRTSEDEPPRSVDVQYATGEEQRNSSRENEKSGLKWKWHSAVDVSGGESKVRCCKEQYCLGTWNVKSMNQVNWMCSQKEKAKVNIDILGISELKWTGVDKRNSDDIISTTMGKNPFEEME